MSAARTPGYFGTASGADRHQLTARLDIFRPPHVEAASGGSWGLARIWIGKAKRATQNTVPVLQLAAEDGDEMGMLAKHRERCGNLRGAICVAIRPGLWWAPGQSGGLPRTRRPLDVAGRGLSTLLRRVAAQYQRTPDGGHGALCMLGRDRLDWMVDRHRIHQAAGVAALAWDTWKSAPPGSAA